MKNRLIICAIVIILLLSSLITYVSTGSHNFEVLILLAALWKWSFVPALIISILLWKKRNRQLKWLSRICSIWTLIIIFSMPSYWIGKRILNTRVAVSKQSADDIVRIIEDYHEKNGSYPRSIESLNEKGHEVQLPLFADEDFYRYENNSFYLTLPNPAVFHGYWEYSSITGSWQYAD